jgi:hypothetical protein
LRGLAANERAWGGVEAQRYAARVFVTEIRIMLSLARKYSRLFAGLLFSVVGLVIVLIALITFNKKSLDTMDYSLFLVLPVIVCGTGGALFGSVILDPSQIRTTFLAGKRGALVVLSSFVAWVILISIIISILNPVESGADIFLTFLIYGLVVLGWLMVIFGAGAGWFLHFLSKKAALRALGEDSLAS